MSAHDEFEAMVAHARGAGLGKKGGSLSDSEVGGGLEPKAKKELPHALATWRALCEKFGHRGVVRKTDPDYAELREAYDRIMKQQ
jgi:hypothetical protein